MKTTCLICGQKIEFAKKDAGRVAPCPTCQNNLVLKARASRGLVDFALYFAVGLFALSLAIVVISAGVSMWNMPTPEREPATALFWFSGERFAANFGKLAVLRYMDVPKESISHAEGKETTIRGEPLVTATGFVNGRRYRAVGVREGGGVRLVHFEVVDAGKRVRYYSDEQWKNSSWPDGSSP